MPSSMPTEASHFSPIDWSILAGYFALMFVIGHLAGRRKTTAVRMDSEGRYCRW